MQPHAHRLITFPPPEISPSPPATPAATSSPHRHPTPSTPTTASARGTQCPSLCPGSPRQTAPRTPAHTTPRQQQTHNANLGRADRRRSQEGVPRRLPSRRGGPSHRETPPPTQDDGCHRRRNKTGVGENVQKPGSECAVGNVTGRSRLKTSLEFPQKHYLTTEFPPDPATAPRERTREKTQRARAHLGGVTPRSRKVEAAEHPERIHNMCPSTRWRVLVQLAKGENGTPAATWMSLGHDLARNEPATKGRILQGSRHGNHPQSPRDGGAGAGECGLMGTRLVWEDRRSYGDGCPAGSVT